jgi:hypothetical protein
MLLNNCRTWDSDVPPYKLCICSPNIPHLADAWQHITSTAVMVVVDVGRLVLLYFQKDVWSVAFHTLLMHGSTVCAESIT